LGSGHGGDVKADLYKHEAVIASYSNMELRMAAITSHYLFDLTSVGDVLSSPLVGLILSDLCTTITYHNSMHLVQPGRHTGLA
jgi:hypothetical protein